VRRRTDGRTLIDVRLTHLETRRRKSMSLIQLVIILVVVGVILWAINNYIPMQANIKKILNIVVVIVVILFILNAFGIIGSGTSIRIGSL
jgi:hypothetical protein